MIGVVLCTHLNLGQALLDTAEMIVGAFPQSAVVAVEPGDGMEIILERLRGALAEVDTGAGVVLLCDMFGGTPSNLSLSFLGEGVEVVTGVNLPMLLKLFNRRQASLAEVARLICKHARENIHVAGDLLGGGDP